MSRTNADANSESYPSYVGWEVHQPSPFFESDEFCKDLEQLPKLEDTLTDTSEADATPPVLNSESTHNL